MQTECLSKVYSVFFLAHCEKVKAEVSSSNQVFTMLTEFANHQDNNVQQQITGDDIVTNLEFLRAAGLLEPPFTLPDDKNDASAMLALTKAVKALAKDV